MEIEIDDQPVARNDPPPSKSLNLPSGPFPGDIGFHRSSPTLKQHAYREQEVTLLFAHP
jgi:hypothetical protein